MTVEAEIARHEALQFECKLDAIRRNQDGTVKLTLTIQNIDFPPELMSDPMGQRYVTVMVAKNEDETPKVRRRFNELPPSQRAALLIRKPDFHRFLGVQTVEEADAKLKELCAVDSKSKILEEDLTALETDFGMFLIEERYER